MRKIIGIAIVLAFALMLCVSSVSAQGEGIASRLSDIMIDDIPSSVNVSPLPLGETYCRFFKIHDETIHQYQLQFRSHPVDIYIAEFRVYHTSNSIEVLYRQVGTSRYVFEKWTGCEFLGATEWQELQSGDVG